jgi:hypothetical protein
MSKELPPDNVTVPPRPPEPAFKTTTPALPADASPVTRLNAPLRTLVPVDKLTDPLVPCACFAVVKSMEPLAPPPAPLDMDTLPPTLDVSELRAAPPVSCTLPPTRDPSPPSIAAAPPVPVLDEPPLSIAAAPSPKALDPPAINTRPALLLSPDKIDTSPLGPVVA